MQKYITNAFFALMSGLGSFALSELKSMNQKIDAIEHTVYKQSSFQEVQREINEGLQFTDKDHEIRLRKQEQRRYGG